MTVMDCKILQLPKISNSMGSISFAENFTHVPFEMKRIYYIYDLPEHASRGAHGHKKLQQLVIAIAGSFDFVIDDGFDKKTFRLDRPDQGLYITPMIWRDLCNFSANSICLVLASELYDESDYYRDYDSFLKDARKERS